MKRLRLATVVAMLIVLLLPPVIAFAQDVVDPGRAKPPPSGIIAKSGSGDELEGSSGLQIRFINRANIEIIVSYKSQSVFPGSSNSLTFQDILGEKLTRMRHSDNQYALPVEDDSEAAAAFTRALGTFVEIDNGESDNLETRWIKQDVNSSAFAQRYLNNAKMRVRTMLAPDGYGCNPNFPGGLGGNSPTDYLGIINATDDNIEGSDDTVDVAWACAGGNGADDIKNIKSRFTDLENYNITHVASADGKQLTIVFEGNDLDKDSFKYCENGVYALGLDGGTCESGGRDGFTLSGSPDQLTGSSNTTLDLKKNGSKVGEIMVAGATSTANVGPSVGDTQVAPACEDNGGVLSWIVCPILEFIDNQIASLDNQIQVLLEVPPGDVEDGGTMNEAWKATRNIAYLILVPVVLVMVIGTALGFEFLSAYTVKRALPRLIAATIFIALSWEICQFLIILTNNVGRGVLGLITSPFGDNVPTSLADVLGGGGGLLAVAATGVVAGGAVLILGPALVGILLSYGFVALVAIFMGFLVLTLRQVLILLLILAAPLAILAWIFPGNDKFWKLWWGTFSKLLIMYPLIVALIAMGRVFAGVTSVSQGGILEFLVKLIAYIAPYFFIPATFKFAGGIFATVAGMANDRSRGLFDRQRKSRAEMAGSAYRDWKSGAVQDGIRGSVSRGVGRRVGVGMKGRYGLGGRARTQAAFDKLGRDAAVGNIMKGPDWDAVNQNDDALHAATYSSADEAQRALTARFDGDAARATRAVAAVQTSIGFGRPQAIAAAQQLVSTGTGYDDIQDMTQTLARASGGNRGTASALAGFANAETKKVGRSDLAPSFSNLDKMVRSAGGMSDAGEVAPTAAEATEAGWNSGSLYALSNGKPTATKAFAEHWTQEYGAALQSGDQERIIKAEAARKEFKAMLPNATGDNAKVINDALDSYEQIESLHMNRVGPENASRVGGELGALRQVAEQRARTYDRDPAEAARRAAES